MINKEKLKKAVGHLASGVSSVLREAGTYGNPEF